VLVEPVVIIVPVLDRPHRVRPLMTDVAAATTERYRLLFVADDTDDREIDALEQNGADYIVVGPDRATYAKKINDGIRVSSEPWIFTGADDLHFHPAWLELACAGMDDHVQVSGTKDLLNPTVTAGTASTHSLVKRSYVQEVGGTLDGGPGTLFHEGYQHEYPDVEMVEVATMRGIFRSTEAVVEHLHPWGKKAPVDPTYLKGYRTRKQDCDLYLSRRHLWGMR
jgi:glycosyltransferase involved in cell wall biosynthesis